MADSDSLQDNGKRSCGIVDCFSQSWDFLKRKCIGICFLLLSWAGTIAAFILIKDPDWNIAVVPYLCAFVACALVSILCKRGHYDQDRLADIYSQGSRRPNENADFGEVLDSEASPLLSGTSGSVRTEIPQFRSDSIPLEHAEGLFEPAPVISREQREVPRDTQVTVKAVIHPTRRDSSSPKEINPELPRGSFSTASGSDPQNSSAAPDSGIALQSTAQSTFVSGRPKPRPPPRDSEQPQQNLAGPTSPTEKSTRF